MQKSMKRGAASSRIRRKSAIEQPASLLIVRKLRSKTSKYSGSSSCSPNAALVQIHSPIRLGHTSASTSFICQPRCVPKYMKSENGWTAKAFPLQERLEQAELKRRKASGQRRHTHERNRFRRRHQSALSTDANAAPAPNGYLSRPGLISGRTSGRTSGAISGLISGRISGRISGLISGRIPV